MQITLDNREEIIQVDALLAIARKAGAAILDIYHDAEKAGDIQYKQDASPLTLADTASNQVIVESIAAITPYIPVLSEEGKEIPLEVRQHWTYYWCIDPLDGTKEFIKRNGEFTVNIALIHKDKPVFGIIYQPVADKLYFGGQNIGSWKISSNLSSEKLSAAYKGGDIIAVGSRTHSDPQEEVILNSYGVKQFISAGSSLKFCMIAEGSAHLYYRHGPTMEWDTAAGHAIATSAGAVMTNTLGEPFVYNKPSLLNGSFICKAAAVHQIKST